MFRPLCMSFFRQFVQPYRRNTQTCAATRIWNTRGSGYQSVIMERRKTVECQNYIWPVYVLWLAVSPWKFSPTVKGSRCQGHSLTEIKTFLIVKVIRHNAITQCTSGNAWADVSRSSIRFTYSSIARHIGPCICHNSQTYTWNDVIPYKGRMIRVLSIKVS